MRPRLLDLFCGAGGASMGYHLAGFEVIGVDLHPQPNYPFEFHRADALTCSLDGYDAIAASPPCQRHSAMSVCRPGLAATYPDLIDPIRQRLGATGLPYVLENVPGAPLRKDAVPSRSRPTTPSSSAFSYSLISAANSSNPLTTISLS